MFEQELVVTQVEADYLEQSTRLSPPHFIQSRYMHGLVVNLTYPIWELLLTVLFHVLAVEKGC